MMKFERQAGNVRELTIIRAEFGQCVGRDGGAWGPVLRGGADLW